jgi:hypothetical protein
MEPEKPVQENAADNTDEQQPTVAQQAKEVAAKNADSEAKDGLAVDMNSTPAEQPVVDEKAKSKDTDKPKHHRNASLGLAVGVAIIITVVLVLLGVLAYQNSDVSTNVEEDAQTNQVDLGPVTGDEIQSQLDSVDSGLEELEQDLEDVNESALTDDTLELE